MTLLGGVWGSSHLCLQMGLSVSLISGAEVWARTALMTGLYISEGTTILCNHH